MGAFPMELANLGSTVYFVNQKSVLKWTDDRSEPSLLSAAVDRKK
jgi:hypothetical protein